MAFEFQHGDVADIAALGIEAGQATKAARLHDQAMRFAEIVQAQKNAMRMAEAKMEMQFQRDLRAEQFELEKINLRNQHDFDFQEQKRLDEMGMQHVSEMKRKAGLDNAMQAVQEQIDAGFVSEEEGRRHMLNLRTKYDMGPGSPTIRPQGEDNVLGMLKKPNTTEAGTGDSETIRRQKSLLSQQKEAQAEGKLLVQRPDGQIGKVPRDEIEAGLASGAFKLLGTNAEEQTEQQRIREERERERLKAVPTPTQRRGYGMGFYF
jgi:hypothetical protein